GIRDFHVTGVQTCALPISWIDGGQGIALTRVGYPALFESMTEYLYYLGLGTAVLAVSVAAAIQYSRLGRGLFAIHDDERVAEGQIGRASCREKRGLLDASD